MLAQRSRPRPLGSLEFFAVCNNQGEPQPLHTRSESADFALAGRDENYGHGVTAMRSTQMSRAERILVQHTEKKKIDSIL